jgi:hypothetical protein
MCGPCAPLPKLIIVSLNFIMHNLSPELPFEVNQIAAAEAVGLLAKEELLSSGDVVQHVLPLAAHIFDSKDLQGEVMIFLRPRLPFVQYQVPLCLFGHQDIRILGQCLVLGPTCAYDNLHSYSFFIGFSP